MSAENYGQAPALRHSRPKADLQLLIIMLRLQPALPPFAVAEKSGDRRIHTVRMGRLIAWCFASTFSHNPAIAVPFQAPT